MKTKGKVSRSHEDATIESFRKDPGFAAEYLNSILEDGDQQELMAALRRMSKAFGGVQKLADHAKLNANTLYRTLSPKVRSFASATRFLRKRAQGQFTDSCPMEVEPISLVGESAYGETGNSGGEAACPH